MVHVDETTKQVAQTCSLFSAPDGRVYRPRDCERLVLYLKDINLPRPDKYDTCMLIAFLQQLQTFGGFYDENLEFLRLERVHVRNLFADGQVGCGRSLPWTRIRPFL